MSNYNIRTFSNGPNKMRSADDYINRKKATTLYTVAASNTSSRAKNSNIPVKTTNLVGNPKLASVGGYNVNSYDLLMNISKGRYYVAPEGRYAELLNNPLFTSDISNNIKINDCSNTLINTKTTIQTPINQTWDLYEGSYLIDKDESISEWCKCTPNKLSKNRDLQIDSRLIYNSNALPQSSPSQIFFNGGARSVARWNNSDKLRGFSYPKIFCIPFSNNNNNNNNPLPVVFSVTGGTQTTSGDYTLHTFTSNDDLIISIISGDPASTLDFSYLLVGGGGAGGGAGSSANGTGPNNRAASGAGGGGGEVIVGNISLIANTYPITIGSGGQPKNNNQIVNNNANGGDGGDTTFNIFTARGGIGGQGNGPSQTTNYNGGTNGNTTNTGGNGAHSQLTNSGCSTGGGGGGASENGSNAIAFKNPNNNNSQTFGGNGGDGYQSLAPFSGSYYGGGGGGGAASEVYVNQGTFTGAPGLGGQGGGGNGGTRNGFNSSLDIFPTNGQNGFGGGGGGGATVSTNIPTIPPRQGTPGGSGVAIIAYLTSYTM